MVESDIAQVTGTRLGDSITVQTAAGPASFRVIGISANQQEAGTALLVPLTTMHAILTGMSADANDYWVQTTSHDHAFIDTTTTRIKDTLTVHGYDVNSGSEGSALMKLRQPFSVVPGARRSSSRPMPATTISRPPCAR